jgi:hypothetical protein
MTYRPTERVFLPPWRFRVPAIAYFAAASGLLAVVMFGTRAAPGTELHAWVVSANANRLITPTAFAMLLWVSAAATLGRTLMRGVRVLEDGVEYRDIVGWVWPRRRKFRWPQMDCIVLDQPTRVAVDLWDGTRCFLPVVADHRALCDTLTRVAIARAIPLRGAPVLDDLPGPEELELS